MALILLPGLIDCHVHFREPGLTQKGDMETEARAALAGGVTTVCEMPNTRPPTITVEALRDKIKRAEKIKDLDIRFLFGVTKEEDLEELRRAWGDKTLRMRLVGAKVFMDHSTGDQKADEDVVEKAFALCGALGIPVSCHCEDPGLNAAAVKRNKRTDIAAHSLIRPPEAEETAVRTAIALAETFRTPLHIAHLSTAGAAARVREAKKRGLPVTCEVAPHHLFLTVDDYATLGTLAKMNPPVRSKEDRDALWAAIADGTVDCIATDHAPHTLEEKRNGEPLKAPSGVPGVETMLPLLLTVAAGKWPGTKLQASSFKLSYEDTRRLCFENPNRIFHLGKNADDVRVEIDPEKEWVIEGKKLHSKCGWTPYEGWRVIGKVERVIR